MPKSLYLRRKHSGGAINKRGNDYETCFACFKIMQLTEKFRSQLNSIVVSSQGRGYVDDLWIQNLIPGEPHETCYQLRTSHTLHWGKRTTPGTLSYDFHQQKDNLTKKGVNFCLELVVSKRKVHKSMHYNLAKTLTNVCTVYHFPWSNTIDRQVVNCRVFRQAATALCASTDTDKLQSLVSHFVGAWVASGGQNVSLDHLLAKIESRGAYIFLKSATVLTLSPQLVAILDVIPNFRYQIVQGYLAYYYGDYDSGFVPYMINSQEFRNIESEIIAEHPATFNELEPLILS
ncbi:hypothetical protein [Chitinophaga sp.]|uniref:hypothetical protein n=1 Tax=Chitinophaga sp. TaxID=1869181 RepID=UPI0031D67229